MRQALVYCASAVCVVSVYSCSWPPAETDPGGVDVRSHFEETNPLGANAACYICHMTFVKEQLSRTHLRAEVGCIRCHGISAGHANDEDIGATPPDVSFKRDQVDTMCRKCHKSHDIPAEHVVGRWLERNLHEQPPICTDCHGTHWINGPTEGRGNDKDPAQKVSERSRKSFPDENGIDGPAVLEYPIGVESRPRSGGLEAAM